MPKLIREINILHPACFNAGPRIEKLQYFQFNNQTLVVEFWYENGKIHHISDRPLRTGEVV